MDERRGRALLYLVGTAAVSVGLGVGVAWWAGVVASGAMIVVGVVVGAKK